MKKIVLATGCFDLLHQGHRKFLKAAKAQGDLLIVGLETDKRVRQLKGKGRPINKLAARLKNLAKIKVVDLVFPLPESFGDVQAHLELLRLVKPDILALSQNTPHIEVKKKLIEKTGGRLFVFPFDNRFSTSKLIKNQIISTSPLDKNC